MELIIARKEGVVIDMQLLEEDNTFEPKLVLPSDTVFPTLRTLNTYFLMLVQATHAAIDIRGPSPSFDMLREFFEILELEYGGIRHDQMQ